MRGLITAREIASIKGSGVVTKIVDNTVRSQILPQGEVRLIYGFSKDGVFNRPVLLEAGDVENSERIYGSRDRKLERKGSWFHRSLEIALNEGSVLALNLLKTNNEVDAFGVPTANADVSDYKSFSMSPNDVNGDKQSKLYASYFAKDRFWIPDTDYLLATRESSDAGSILNFTNTSQKKYTFIIRKADVSGFDVTVKDWYADSDKGIPAFLKSHDLIEDYFIDVYVLAGDYSDYDSLKNDVILGNYFDERGIITSEFDNFLNTPEVVVVRQFQGTFIPNFLDKDGSVKSIDTIINSGIDSHGILCAIDRDELDKFEDGNNTKSIDLVGHSLINPTVTEIDMLSYKRQISTELSAMFKKINFDSLDSVTDGWTIINLLGKITVSIPNTVGYFAVLNTMIKEGDLVVGETTAAGISAGITYANPYLQVSNVVSTPTTYSFELSNLLKESEISASNPFVVIADSTNAGSADPVGTLDISVGGDDYVGTYAPSAGEVITVYAESDFNKIVVAQYTYQAADTNTQVADGLAANVVAPDLTLTSLAGVMTITYPASQADYLNGTSIHMDDVTNGLITTGTLLGGDSPSDTFKWNKDVESMYKYNPTTVVAEENSSLYKDYVEGKIKDGDYVTNGETTAFVRFQILRDASTFQNLLNVTFFSDAELTAPVPAMVAADLTGFSFQGEVTYTTSLPELSTRITGDVVSDNVFRIPIADAEGLSVDEYLVGLDVDSNKILTRITGMVQVGSPIPTHVDITTQEKISVYPNLNGTSSIIAYNDFESIFDRLQAFYLKGLEIKDSHKPNGTNLRMKEIISVMTDTQMRKALVDPEMINFRYLVDTFNHGLEKNQKNYLSSLVKERRKSMAILNMPSTKEYLNSVDPVFTDDATPENPVPAINPKFIAEGGNKSKNPLFLAVRPTEDQGASYAMFFYPNVNELEDDSDVSSVPPAAHISNNFVSKWKTNDGFKAAAGKFRGVISDPRIIGLDHDLDKNDRGELETKGINPIREKDGEFQIFGNQTAYHKFKSVLNQANSRDTLITIEIGIENILDSYIFEDVFSDDIMRTTIQTTVENYLASIQTLNGITTYSVKFDRQNNPDFVLQENASIIDIEVELPNITRKFFSRITLVGGDASVSSFSAV